MRSTERLTDVTEFILDGTHGSPERTQCGVPVLSAQNVNSGRLNYATERFTSEAEYQAFRRRLAIRSGDVLLTIVGTIGRSAIVEEDSPIVFQRSVAVIRPKDGVLSSSYLMHVVRSQAFQSQLASATNQSSQAGVYLGKLKELRIPLPPMEEQRRIAAILDQAEALRAKRRQALAKLDTLTQSLFLEMFGDPATNSMGLKIEPLGKHLQFITSGGRGWARFYASSGSRFIRSLDVQMNYIGAEDIVYVDPPDNAEARRTRIKTADVLLTITGSRIGRVATTGQDLEGAYISQHVAILRTKPDGIEPDFLSFFLSLNAGGQRQIAASQYGQTKPGLNFDQIHRFAIPVPPVDQQREFRRRVMSFEKLKAAGNTAMTSQNTLFVSLQARAFRGEL